MKVGLVLFASSLLFGCGDSGSGGAGAGGSAAGGEAAGGEAAGGEAAGGSGQGGVAEGGAAVGGAGGGAADTLSLTIAADELAMVTCASYVDGVWATADTGFDQNGEVINLDCALVAVVVDGAPYWITSRTFEGLLGTSSDLRHAFATAEAPVAVGSEAIELDDVDFAPLFTGTLEVVTQTATTVAIRLQ